MSEDWLLRLKAAYEAGYYRTESDEAHQGSFPWKNKTCRDCPFWLNSVCRVHAVVQPPDAHTCQYFDPPNHAAGQHIIESRMREAWNQWWCWRTQQGD